MPNLQPNEIVVVSGLPRSGTSMMMQMIEAGGIPALTDSIRASDDDNPRGYYELEPVKKLKQSSDHAWLAEAHGRVIKVIHLLLGDLPPDHRYRIVMMNRDLDEVLASQAAMLQRSGKPVAEPARLKPVFESQLAQARATIAARPEMTLLDINHRDAITNPADVAQQLDAFLGGLNTDAIVSAVDPDLYRNRS
ncbi:sulfotransferase family protein [Mucisphaera calidilacus]|uniref:Sulfotransferase family protein n=1 Tax=Mucisphaera calidilacus TaxID=2527982 RepID=A0A518BY13_9BACT|nr:sulfotransferase family protein [Mucisphaera calidilacus]QDU71860.1 hypothetical protein Pan265_17160 [Mucisphaera calidilacus]